MTKCKKYPVKRKKLSKKEVLELATAAMPMKNGAFYLSQVYQPGTIVVPEKARMQKNPFLQRMEEKYNNSD